MMRGADARRVAGETNKHHPSVAIVEDGAERLGSMKGLRIDLSIRQTLSDVRFAGKVRGC